MEREFAPFSGTLLVVGKFGREWLPYSRHLAVGRRRWVAVDRCLVCRSVSQLPEFPSVALLVSLCPVGEARGITVMMITGVLIGRNAELRPRATFTRFHLVVGTDAGRKLFGCHSWSDFCERQS